MDIDIDVKNRDKILNLLKHVPASEKIENDGELKKHIVGIHVQDIPRDPTTNIASLVYKKAEKKGFYKIDILNNHVYDEMSNTDIEKYMNMEIDWDLLKDRTIVENLAHIHDYYELLNKFNPRNIHELAAFLALIRPSKKYLRNKTKKEIMKNIWKKEEKGFYFKKSHAYAYALMITIQLNHIKNKEEKNNVNS